MSMETDRIEADLDQSRHRLNDTLNALGNKLSPGQMVDEVLGLAQGQAGQFAAKLGSQVRDNPMPTILIAAGIAWLMLNKRHGLGGENLSADDWRHEHRYRSLEEARWSTPRMANETDDAYEERVHAAYATALDLKQRAGEAAHDFKERVARAVDGARQAATGVRERMSRRRFQSRPQRARPSPAGRRESLRCAPWRGGLLPGHAACGRGHCFGGRRPARQRHPA